MKMIPQAIFFFQVGGRLAFCYLDLLNFLQILLIIALLMSLAIVSFLYKHTSNGSYLHNEHDPRIKFSL